MPVRQQAWVNMYVYKILRLSYFLIIARILCIVPTPLFHSRHVSWFLLCEVSEDNNIMA